MSIKNHLEQGGRTVGKKISNQKACTFNILLSFLFSDLIMTEEGSSVGYMYFNTFFHALFTPYIIFWWQEIYLSF